MLFASQAEDSGFSHVLMGFHDFGFLDFPVPQVFTRIVVAGYVDTCVERGTQNFWARAGGAIWSAEVATRPRAIKVKAAVC